MFVLVLNCGSSSLKFQLIDTDKEFILAKGLCERIGSDDCTLKYEAADKGAVVIKQKTFYHKDAIDLVLQELISEKDGVIKSTKDIWAVGHRIVHGGAYFNKSAIVDDDVINKLEQCILLAPLHTPAHITGIRACQTLLPGVPEIVVFDTVFHNTMPKKAYTYGIPKKLSEKHNIRKYGFHGTSHSYVSKRVMQYLDVPVEESKVVICHLGNGASISAVKGGKCIDTSMGFTPLDGLVMGTRCGSIDPAAVLFLMERENLTPLEADRLLNKKSGLLGISGVSSDFRDVEIAAMEGNEDAKDALEVFKYRIATTIGGYITALGGIDALVFTAGIGENSITTREGICEYFEYLGLKLDKDKNNVRNDEREISADDSKVKVFIIPTDEEIEIAREVKQLLDK